ncbi:hypothetical protein CAPTEDRAFT_207895 [Capitella teleta]|uniref:Uncharacterized protein n=1 Tax=Capitella teleta TaxID=283909 RepID=R7VFG8_CAPTE|nr:hypothetical protein CAPTEDRAFT_207895 [Capitella teleta]|eukprot:ELU17588.1 hypothetical protein CAPTEDRAFT_207895 [Capitella teleta]
MVADFPICQPLLGPLQLLTLSDRICPLDSEVDGNLMKHSAKEGARAYCYSFFSPFEEIATHAVKTIKQAKIKQPGIPSGMQDREINGDQDGSDDPLLRSTNLFESGMIHQNYPIYSLKSKPIWALACFNEHSDDVAKIS